MRLALTSIALAYSMSAEPRRSFGTEIASASPKPPRFVDVNKFDVADGAAARAHLDDRGFVVFRSVLDQGEVARANELFFDYVEALGSGVDRNDVSTWGDDRWPPCAGMLVYYPGSVSASHRSCGLFARGRALPRPTARREG